MKRTRLCGSWWRRSTRPVEAAAKHQSTIRDPQSIRNPQSAIRNVAVGGDDRADVEDCHQHEQKLIASKERQVLADTADHRPEQVRAEIAGRRRRALEAAAE